eukprot:1185046-Prorocentrum_minimum.AAC.6
MEELLQPNHGGHGNRAGESLLDPVRDGRTIGRAGHLLPHLLLSRPPSPLGQRKAAKTSSEPGVAPSSDTCYLVQLHFCSSLRVLWGPVKCLPKNYGDEHDKIFRDRGDRPVPQGQLRQTKKFTGDETAYKTVKTLKSRRRNYNPYALLLVRYSNMFEH